MNFNKPAFQVKKISYRKVKTVDIDCLKGDLALLDLYNGGQGTPLSSSELDMLVCDYEFKQYHGSPRAIKNENCEG